MRILNIITALLCVMLVHSGYAQVWFRAVDAHTGLGIPFVHFLSSNGAYQSIADINGLASFSTDSVSSIQVYQEEYQFQTLKVDVSNDSLHPYVVKLEKNVSNDSLTHSTSLSWDLMKHVLENEEKNSAKLLIPYTTRTYNKSFLTSNKVLVAKNLFDKILNYFSFRIKRFDRPHHLLISESVTEKKYIDAINHSEVTLSSRFSGIDNPLLVAFNSNLHSFTVYDPIIYVGTKPYFNPAHERGFKKYNFSLSDWAVIEKDTIYVVRFDPKSSVSLGVLKGYLYISSTTKAIQSAVYEPVFSEGSLTIRISIENQRLPNNVLFPKSTHSTYKLSGLRMKDQFFILHSQSYNINPRRDTSIYKHDFSEIVYSYKPNAESVTNDLITQHRNLPLDSIEQATYLFYDTLGRIQNFHRVINLAEKVYSQRVPYKFIDLELRKLIDINAYEGIRPGIGLETNEKLSSFIHLNGYVGYGQRDRVSKWAVGARLLPDSLGKWEIDVGYKEHIEEAGATNFVYNKWQYGTEWTRHTNVSIMDYVYQSHAILRWHPQRFIQLESGVTNTVFVPGYTYVYKESVLHSYNTSEISLGMKWNYGETYFQALHQKVSLGTDYPKLWVQYKTGKPSSQFSNYHKLETKIEYSVNLLGLGRSSMQWVGAKVWGDLPYGMLYNGKGSWGMMAVVHNSFETMMYNEFLSDMYTAFYFSHDFGFIRSFKYRYFRPKLMWAFNAGIGSLSNKNNHKIAGVAFKEMSNPYLETGVLIDNLAVVHLAGLKLGMGMGMYQRIGYYASPSFFDNTLFKIATNIEL